MAPRKTQTYLVETTGFGRVVIERIQARSRDEAMQKASERHGVRVTAKVSR